MPPSVKGSGNSILRTHWGTLPTGALNQGGYRRSLYWSMSPLQTARLAPYWNIYLLTSLNNELYGATKLL